MARKFLTAIDLTKNELQNPAIHNLAAAPSAPVKGQMYFDTVGNIMYWYNGTAWVSAAGGSVAFGVVPAETTFGLARADGVATTAARSDHTHGSPAHSAAEHSTIPISALATATAAINMGGFNVTNVNLTPTAGSDAASKNYVDNVVAGLSWKAAARMATTGNVVQSGLAAIDGVTPVANDRILCKDQSSQAFNGIWLAASGAWTRALDNNTEPELVNAAVFVSEGAVNADTAWVCTVNAPVVVGTTSLLWVQFAGGGAVVAGAGMTQAANTLNVIGDTSITVTADQISRAALTGDVTAGAGANATTIANDAVTNAKLANMAALTVKGNDTAGVADPLDLTVAQLRAMLGFARKQVTACAAAVTTVVAHNFGTTVNVQVWRATTPFDVVDPDIELTDANTVTVRFAVAPTAGQYWIQVIG